MYINTFLKNFFFLKKQTNKNQLITVDFKNYYFFLFCSLFYSFFFLNYFYNNNILNLFKKKIFNKQYSLIRYLVSEEDSKKKRFFIKLFYYNNIKYKNIFTNQFNLTKFSVKKQIISKKINFSKNTFFTINSIFFKNKIKKIKKFSFYFILFFKNFIIINFSINIFSYMVLNQFFEINKLDKNNFFYKNIFKNFFFIKNINQFFLNKNYFLLNNNLLDNFKINFSFLKNINYLYNNQYPLIFFKTFNKNIFHKFNLKKKKNFLNLFNSYVLNFFEFFFKKNFFLKISNKIQLNQYKKFFLFLQNYNNNIKFQKFFDSNEMIELVCIVFLYKDLVLLKNWIIFTLNNINIKNHKKFLMIFNDFIVENFSVFSNIFHIKGFYFCIKGKIGLSGNAKKKKLFFKKGLLKVSSKNFKIDNQRFFIKTNCGSLGVNMILTY